MDNKLEQQIIALYNPNLVDLFSINKIATKLKKTYPYVNKKVTELLQRGILKKTIVGKSYLCSLNFENDETLLYLSMNELQKKKAVDAAELDSFAKENMLTLSIQCIVKSKNRLIFVIDDLKDRREIERRFEKAVIVDRKEFADMLIDEPELFKEHTVIEGRESFFRLLRTVLDELKKKHSPLSY